MVPRLTTDLVHVFIAGLMDGDQLSPVLSFDTVDLFAVALLGYLIVRQLPAFDVTEWAQVCAALPAGVTIDPGEWELVMGGDAEILFIPCIPSVPQSTSSLVA